MNWEVIVSGESHGKAVTTVIRGVPANLTIDRQTIDRDLLRRQGGYGRGSRMEIERDQVEIVSGIMNRTTIGSPITLTIENNDWEQWKHELGPFTSRDEKAQVFQPRPGHGDMAGCLKYGFRDCRNVFERSSARETAGRVAAGSIGKQMLEEFGMEIGLGREAASLPGSRVHDELADNESRFFSRATNSAGGLEAGVTNGEPLVVRAAMKPIPTLATPLKSIDLQTGDSVSAAHPRSDVCAVPAASIVGEAELANSLAGAMLKKFGGDSMEEIQSNYRSFIDSVENWF